VCPSRPHHALTFGVTIHATLNDFHLFETKGQPKDLKGLIGLYKHHFDETGYESEKHKKKRFKEGKRFLKEYFTVHKKTISRQAISFGKSHLI